MDSQNIQEIPENSQEIPLQEPENVQEIAERQPENSVQEPENSVQEPEKSLQEIPQIEAKRGRPKKSEEEKRITRQQKYQRAKERRQVRVIESNLELPTIPKNQDTFQPIKEPNEPASVYQRPESSLEFLQRALRESKEQERLQKEALYDSWFERLKRNARH